MSGREPITTELRAKLAEYEPQETDDAFVTLPVGRTGYDAMIAKCSDIDAVHANLERENSMLIEIIADLEEYDRLQSENAKLRDSLKALMMGTYAELCADRGESQCRECAMRRGDESCVIADAMELLGIDVFGEPLGGE